MGASKRIEFPRTSTAEEKRARFPTRVSHYPEKRQPSQHRRGVLRRYTTAPAPVEGWKRDPPVLFLSRNRVNRIDAT